MQKAFVSRGSEIQQLQRYENQVLLDQKLKIVLIQGDVGVGKTRLVDYFLENVANRREFLIGRGRCSMETEAEGLLPFAQVLADLTHQGLQWNAIKGNFADFLKKVAPAWLDIFTIGFAKAVTTTIDEGSKLVVPKFSKLSQDSVFLQYTNAIKEIVKKRPEIIFIDDLHWADKSSLKLLFTLANNLKDAPILIITTFRPVEAMETGANAEVFRDVRANLFRLNTTEIELKEGISVASYVYQKYEAEILPLELVDRIQRRTDGHALFISELFKLWEERSLIRSTTDETAQRKWEISNNLDIAMELPMDLKAVFGERIRLLDQLLQEALKIASVEGEDFTAQTIAKLLKVDDLDMFGDLLNLEKKYRLVEEKGHEEIGQILLDFYRFTHRFVRDFVYHQLSEGQRRTLHLQVGECMESIYANASPVAGQLARHFLSANRLEKAAKYFLLAAQTEQTRFAWIEAENLCQACLDILDKLPYEDHLQRRIQVLQITARGYYNTSEYNRAIDRLLSAIKIVETEHLVSDQALELYAFLADAYENVGSYKEGLEVIEKGKHLLAERKQALNEVDISINGMEGLLKIRFGDEQAAIEVLRKSLKDAETLEQTPSLLDTLAGAYNNLGIAHSFLGMYTESVPLYQKAGELADQVGDKSLQITCFLNLVDDDIILGNYKDAEKIGKKMLALSKQIGDRDNEAYSLYELGLIELKEEHLQEAESYLKQTIAVWEDIGSNYLSMALSNLAAIYISRSQPELAMDYARRGWDIAPSEYEHAYAQLILARADVLAGMFSEAEPLFVDLISPSQKEGNYPSLVGDAQRYYADMLIKNKQVERARELLREALLTYQALGLTREMEEIQKILKDI